MKVDEKIGKVVGAQQVKLEDEVMLINDQGNIIRTFVDQVRETARNTKGVRIIRLGNDSKLIALERIAAEASDQKDQIADGGNDSLNSQSDEAGSQTGSGVEEQ